jgi:hypothetical protein
MAVLPKDENVPFNPLSKALWYTTFDLIKHKEEENGNCYWFYSDL